MRSFALAVLCVTPTLLASACGDNLQPPDDLTLESDPSGYSMSGEPRAIAATLDVSSPSCDAATASFEALARYTDNSMFLKSFRCRVTFDDGAVSDQCLGEHTFAQPGPHTFILEVTDLDTGATARVETKRTIAVPLEVDLALDLPECGLELGFDVTLSTGAEVHVTMSPPEKVVEPHVFGRTGRFEVREPGTYTIVVSAEDERATGPICSRSVSRTVELRACHDHGPGCGH